MIDRPRYPVLAVSVCLTDGAHVLLVERGRPPLAGRFSLPGGKVRLGERLDAAARRELEEETGLKHHRLRYVTLHEVIEREVHAVIHVFAGPLDPRDAVAGDDASAVRLVPLSQLHAAEARGETTSGLASIVERAAAKTTDGGTTAS